MSQENVEAYKRATEAFNRRDIEAALEELDPAVEWHPAMQAFLGGEAIYRGYDGVREMFRDYYGAFDLLQVEISGIEDHGDRIVAIGLIRARGKESGAQIESGWSSLTEFDNGKATRIRSYLDPNKALEAAGLRE
jgi:ketosteroid isomerase-like protein